MRLPRPHRQAPGACASPHLGRAHRFDRASHRWQGGRVSRSSPAPSLTAQAFWLLVAKTAGFALTIALPLILVRTLSQGEFGLYKQAFLIVATAMTVLPLGFGMTAYYFLPREEERQEAVVLHVLLFHAAVG